MGIFEVLREMANTGSQCIFCNREVPGDACACGECAEEEKRLRNTSAYTGGVLFAYYYDSVIRQLVHAYKYGDRPRYAPIMADSMAKYLRARRPSLRADCVSFVPVHPARLRQRGFDQAEALAAHLSILLDIPCLPLLKRTRDTAPQFDLTAAGRRANIAGAFEATGAAHEGKSILLVDDIYTTGSTMAECVKQLLGAKSVFPFVFARDPAPMADT